MNIIFIVDWVQIKGLIKQHSGLVVEYLTRDRMVLGSSLTGVYALCP